MELEKIEMAGGGEKTLRGVGKKIIFFSVWVGGGHFLVGLFGLLKHGL